MSFARLLCASVFIVQMSLAGAATFDSSVQERQLFRQTREQVQKQQFTKAKPGIAALKRYPLAPYLELPLLLARLDELPYDDVDAFFQRYPDSVSGDSLRAAWLVTLAQHQRWKDFLGYYDAATAGKAQQCWRLEALYQTGNAEQALADTEGLWLSPIDLPTACDGALDRWLAAAPDRLSTRVWQRLALALHQDQEGLARHLADRLSGDDKAQAEIALQVYRAPLSLPGLVPQLGKQEHGSEILGIGLTKMAKLDLDTALDLWKKWSEGNVLKAADSFIARNAIGRQVIGSRGKDALSWLIESDPKGTDSYLLEWRVRLALQSGDWNNIAGWIELMPEDLAAMPRWRYWYARALATTIDPAKTARANGIYKELAADRSFYGFLAADHTALPYRLNHQPLKPSVRTDQVAKRADMRRAREFFVLDEKAAARREWSRALRAMSPAEQQASALLAKEWGWYDQALRVAQMCGGSDDLDLRFPIAYRQTMTSAAKTRNLQTEWLFAVARQESAFQADAKSPVGALGLLQLMPATATLVARSLGMRVAPKQLPKQLLQPEHNIPLGSKYLSDLLLRYNGNRILATAAYNAGPGRVSRLLAQQTHPVSADIWVETFPIRETREYIQSVLAFAVIYSERLGQSNTALVNTSERMIGTPIEVSSVDNKVDAN